MKHFIIYTLACVAVILSGCSSDGDSVAEPSIGVSMHSISVATSGQATKKVTVTATHDWSTELSAGAGSWIKVEPSSGGAGSHEVVVTLAENGGDDPREAVITFLLAGGESQDEIEVSQAKKNALTLKSGNISVGKEGGDVALTVYHNMEGLIVEITPEDDSETPWIMEKPDTRSLTEQELHFTVLPNIMAAQRKATITVSDTGRNIVASAEVEQQGEDPTLTLDVSSVDVSGIGGNAILRITQNVQNYGYTVTPASATSWISTESTAGYAAGDDIWVFSMTQNDSGIERKATITFKAADYDLSCSVEVVQEPMSGALADKSVFNLQMASTGKGVNLVIMGDGYTQQEVNNGKYTTHMKETMESYFSVYPYSKYRDYFNVWMLVGVSNDSGVTVGRTRKNTRFEATIAGDGTTAIDCNAQTVARYLRYVPGLPSVDNEYSDALADINVIMVLNSSEYAGTCAMFATGFSIAMCPRINTGDSRPNYGMRAVVIHEAGGHGFGRLADEYMYYRQNIPQSEVEDMKAWQEIGAFPNVDFTSDRNNVLWRDFLKHTKYTDPNNTFSVVDLFEGGNYYYQGVWRPEQNSCMNDNVDYYNAPSRWAMYRRIMMIAGLPYSFEKFMAQDNPPPPSYSSTSKYGMEKAMTPFAPPILRGKP